MLELLFYSILIKPVIYFLQFNGSVYKAIDSMHLLITILMLLFIYIKGKINYIDLSLMISFAMILLYSYFTNYSLDYYMFNTKSLITSIILYSVFSKREIQEKFTLFIRKKKMILTLQLTVIIILIFISIITKSGFENVWNGEYFRGTLATPHFLAYYTIVLYSISNYLYIITKNKIYIIYAITFICFSALTGARVPFIALCLLIASNILFNKSNKIKLLVIGLISSISFIIFKNIDSINIPMINKFQNISGNSSQLNELTSGRLWFWTYDISKFNSFDSYGKLLGKGFDYPYYINYMLTSSAIWAHNDFINLILSIGIIGCAIYAYFVVKFCVKSKSITLFILLMFLANLNALYGDYNFVLGIPFILVYLKVFSSKQDLVLVSRKDKINTNYTKD